MKALATQPAVEIEYPSSDGQPMAETDVHRDEMVALIETLKDRYRERPDVYVAGNLLLYYEEGDPTSCFAPDVFVAFDVAKRRRRTYRLWEEGKAPDVVFEVSSRKTWLEDHGNKKALCARLGVAEYFLYDPEGDYLEPPLQGFRLGDVGYAPIPPRADGSLDSDVLDLRLRLENDGLRLIDRETDQPLLRPEEQARARREAEARAEAAEAELARLRASLEG